MKMGLLYTTLYVDLDPVDWIQISSNPIIFESLKDNVSLEIMATSQNSYHLQFKKGGKLNFSRVVGKFRLTWKDDDMIKEKTRM